MERPRVTFVILLTAASFAHAQHDVSRMDQVVHSYADNNKFKGSVLVARDWAIVLNKSYGYANLELQRPERIPLIDRPEILVHPVQGFLDQLIARDVVSGVVNDMFLVFLFRSEHAVERFLRGFEREEEVISSVEHEHGLLDAGNEVDGVDFGQRALEV